MHPIQKVSSYLIWIFNVLLIAFPLWIVSIWILVKWAPFKNLIAQGFISTPIQTPEGLINLAHLKLTPLSWSIGIFGAFVSIVPLFLGLLVLKHLFQNYRDGNIFSLENAQKYKYLGWLFLLDGLLAKPICDMLLILSATLSNPTGHRYISINFGTPNLEVLFSGVLVIVISWVMAEGYKLQEDQSLTI
ncbi:MAG: hypothetical protein BGO67_01420 [Alphaproteobacteria bacterium 41-28]|nr:MAG: hypothetical protein BGO67_01420 [Alphaproteobacteria bacterium 41-28]